MSRMVRITFCHLAIGSLPYLPIPSIGVSPYFETYLGLREPPDLQSIQDDGVSGLSDTACKYQKATLVLAGILPRATPPERKDSTCQGI